MKRIPELDGLRGLAILMVVVYHIARLISPHGHRWVYYLQDIAGLGWSGVDLFFVLSGFLIGGILIDARSSTNYFQMFYARRAFRILPIYAAVAVLTSLPVGETVLIPWYSYATFTQNLWFAAGVPLSFSLAVTWSLAVEEQFYLILPAVIRFVSKDKIAYVIGVGIAAAPILRVVLVYRYSEWGNAALALMPCRADSLFLGVAIAMFVRDERKWEWIQRHTSGIVCLTGMLGAGVSIFIIAKQEYPLTSSWIATFGYSWFALLYAGMLVLALLWTNGWYGRVLRASWLRALGTISYTLYLIHSAIIMDIFHGAPQVETGGDAYRMVLGVSVSLLVAIVSWFCLEKPLLRFGHRFKY